MYKFVEMWPWSSTNKPLGDTKKSSGTKNKAVNLTETTRPFEMRNNYKNKTSAEIISETKSMLANGRFYVLFIFININSRYLYSIKLDKESK